MTGTLAIARQLEAAGVDRKAAEAHADVIRQSIQTQQSGLVTKSDLRAELANLEQRIDHRLVGLERRIYGMMLAVVGLFSTLLFTALQLF